MLTSSPTNMPDLRRANSLAVEASADIVRRDSSLPGLPNLLQPESLKTPIAELLQTETLSSVQLNYLRYKPHRRCIALLDVNTHHGRELITATAMTADSWNKFRQKSELALAAGHVLQVDSRRLILERFPYDRHLRHIAKLSHEQSRGRLLRRILPIHHDLRHLDCRNVQLERLAYKPARRFVVSVDFDERLLQNRVGKYVLKFHSQSTFQAAAGRIRTIGRLMLPEAMPADCCERYQAIATPWVPGQSLADLLSDGNQLPASSTLQEVGRTLAKLHAFDLPADVDVPVANAAKAASDLRRLADDLAFLYPPLAEDVRQVFSTAYQSLSNDNHMTLIHGDFYAKQVVVDGQNVRFIDFDAVSIGSPWSDVGNFVARLYWNHIRGQMTADRLHWAIHHFHSGYRQRSGWNESAYRSCLAIGLLKCMPHTFRLAADNWPDLFARLLSLACGNMLGHGQASPEPFHSNASPQPTSHQLVNPLPSTGQIRRALKQPTTYLEFPLTQLRLQDASVLRLKPDRRCLMECRFISSETISSALNHSCATDVLCILGKIRFKGLDHATPQLHCRLHQAGLHEGSVTRVPRFLGTVPALNMWLQEKICAKKVTADAQTPVAVHAAVAEALAKLHATDVVVDRQHGVSDEIKILDRRLGEVASQVPEWKHQIELILYRCAQLAAELVPTHNRLLHRDFYFDQVLYDGPQITLLDLDLAAMGPPELDAGNYIAHLLEYAIRSPESSDYCRRAALAFEQSFLQASPSVFRQSVAAWTTISLARHIWISRQITQRQHTTARLLDLLLKPSVSFF